MPDGKWIRTYVRSGQMSQLDYPPRMDILGDLCQTHLTILCPAPSRRQATIYTNSPRLAEKKMIVLHFRFHYFLFETSGTSEREREYGTKKRSALPKRCEKETQEYQSVHSPRVLAVHARAQKNLAGAHLYFFVSVGTPRRIHRGKCDCAVHLCAILEFFTLSGRTDVLIH